MDPIERLRVMSFFILVIVFSGIQDCQGFDCQIFPANYTFITSQLLDRTELDLRNCAQEGDYTTCHHPSTLADSVIGGDNVFRRMFIGGGLYVYSFQNHDYYLWESRHSFQILFTFPSETTLTGITLYYYSDRRGDDARHYGLPRLSFKAVEDDFEIQSTLFDSSLLLLDTGTPEDGEMNETTKNKHFDVRKLPPTRKVFLNKLTGGVIRFALSEIQFFEETNTNCNSTSPVTTSNEDGYQATTHTTTDSSTTTSSSTSGEPTTATTNVVDAKVTTTTHVETNITSTNIFLYIVVPIAFVFLILIGLVVILIAVIFVLLKNRKSVKGREYQDTGEPLYDLPNELNIYDTIPEPESVKIKENEAYGPLPSSHGPGHYELMMPVSETAAAISKDKNVAYMNFNKCSMRY